MRPTAPALSWLHAFIRRRRLVRPDRRPLWRYRATREEIQEASEHVAQLLPRADETSATWVGQLFVLVAAESLRRKQDGRPLSWEVILRPLGYDQPYETLYRLIDKGLRGWRRDLIEGFGRQTYFDTLIVEGGLPLQLLTRDGHALRRYFCRLSRDAKRFRAIGTPVEQLAEELGHELLSARTGQPELLNAAADLVRTVFDLQILVTDALRAGDDPLAALDAVDPLWRERLPMEIDDDVVTELLQDFRPAGAKTERARPTAIRWVRRWREETTAGGEFDAWLELPGLLDEAWLRHCLGLPTEPLPSRLRLFLIRPNGRRDSVALITEIRADGRRAWRIEPLRSRGLYTGSEAIGAFSLWFEDGHHGYGPVALSRGAGPDSPPWTFAKEEDHWVQIGEGAVSRRAEQLRVVADSAWQGSTTDGECHRIASDAAPHGLCWWHVSGDTIWRRADQPELTIRARCSRDSPDYHWWGRTVRLGGRQIFLGAPKLAAFDPTTGPLPPQGDLEWRPRRSRGRWSPLSTACLGDVSLRLVDRGVVRYQTTESVVPSAFELELGAGRDASCGEIRLLGIEDARVGLDSHLVRSIESRSESVLLTVESRDAMPAEIDLQIVWDGGRELSLTVPFPARAAGFSTHDGATLGADSRWAAECLRDIQATATTLDPDERFHVSARLQAADVSQPVEWTEELTRLGAGRFQLDLAAIREPLEKTLTLSRDLEATVALRIEGQQPVAPHSMHVGRCEHPLEIDRSTDIVSAPITATHRPTRIEAIALWRPETSHLLETTDRGFRLPAEKLDAGPWLLLGWDHEWCRFQPTSWINTVGAPVPDEDLTALQKVLRGPEEDFVPLARQQLSAMSTNPQHEGWQLVTASLKRQERLPAGTFSILCELARSPAAAVAALLRSTGAERFAITWSSLEALSFSWRTVPVETWLDAVLCLRRSQRELLADRSWADEEVARRTERLLSVMECHRCFLRPIVAWLRAEIPCDAPGDVSPRSKPTEPTFEALAQELFRRSNARVWPKEPTVLRWLDHAAAVPEALRSDIQRIRQFPAFKWSVLAAPLIVAANTAVDAAMPHELTARDLRSVQTFDSWFFDQTHEYGLRVLLGERGEPSTHHGF